MFEGHFLTLFTSETNRLEGINFSYNDTRELFETGQLSNYTGDLRAALSVANNKAVAEYLNKCLAKGMGVTPTLIKETHRLLMFASMDDRRYHDNGERAGEYKVHDYCVGKYSVGSTPDTVAADVEELCKFLHDKGQADIVKVAAAFMCHFENIHPFADGNGRTGRWITNYILVRGGSTPAVFYSEDKKEYYDALEAFDLEEDYWKMYSYLLGQVRKSKRAYERR